MVGQARSRAALQHVAVATGTQDRRHDQVTGGGHDRSRKIGQTADDLLGLCETDLPAFQHRSAEQRVALQYSWLGEKSYVGDEQTIAYSGTFSPPPFFSTFLLKGIHVCFGSFVSYSTF